MLKPYSNNEYSEHKDVTMYRMTFDLNKTESGSLRPEFTSGKNAADFICGFSCNALQ